MDWNNYKNKYEDITGEIININNSTNTNLNNLTKSNGINDLNNYILITRDNIDDLEIGSHIKYVKNVFDLRTNKTYEKIYNGGFLIEIVDGNMMHTLTLVLKSNIIWKMKFIKYKVYMKPKEYFYKNISPPQYKYQNENYIEDKFRNDNEIEINRRKKEIDKIVQEKLKMKNNKNKHYVLFSDDIKNINSDNDV
jgi:hypothetical protein